ncbi:MAG: lysine--tRNA ligase, partial [Actinomycetota bacterium]
MTERLDDLERQRLAKIEAMRAAGVDPYPVRFEPTAGATELHDRFDGIEPGAETGERVRVAGRLVLHREHGKLSFGVIRDRGADIQLFAQADRLGPQAYAAFGDLDLGDWVGADGEVIKTRKGELSIRCDVVTLLAKALRPLPEKWHGLQDVETRYRQRYLDLIANPQARRVALLRSRTIDAVRAHVAGRGFVEVETPMLHVTPGGANARTFLTHHNTLDLDLHLRIAPELYLKRLIVGGLDRVFEINRNFRNEGISVKYNPEFTMLEAYQAFADYHDMMDLTEQIVASAAQASVGSTRIGEGDAAVDLTPPWPRRTMLSLIRDYAGVDVHPSMPREKLERICDDLDVAREAG